ncbi:MAG: Stp1/IreP family PP2C-type Ser/Thr phosphatase [Lachnospiraceae bacterium]|nr:Stp1/IreP family PP2C-type Ser/Thr phosphatase [Lachnospiraceae bacterium]
MPTSYSITDTGRRRDLNQDYVYGCDTAAGPLPNLYIVADGMGGHQAGDYASRCAVEAVVSFIEESKEENPGRLLEEAFQKANAVVIEAGSAHREYYGMGTTMVAAVILGDDVIAANVGDSRLYMFNEREIRQVTRDHSLVEEMVKAGTISRKQARTHPEKNVITRAIGAEDQLRVDLFRFPLRPGEKILMCTDGLTNMLTDEEILQILSGRTDYDEAAQALVESANRAGGKDNITVLIADPHPAGREGSDD